jgi:hypothetical protein
MTEFGDKSQVTARLASLEAYLDHTIVELTDGSTPVAGAVAAVAALVRPRRSHAPGLRASPGQPAAPCPAPGASAGRS